MSLFADIRSIDDLEVENQRVFVRADLDAPYTKSGDFIDDSCIAAVVPTIKKLQAKGAQVIVGSRFGDARGDGKKKEAPSIEPAAARLSELLGCDVLLPDACVGDSVKKVLTEARAGQICVLENLANGGDRGPEAEALARRLKGVVDVFVADSLRVLGDESASTTYLPRLCEHRAAGVSLMRELSAVARIQSGIDNPRLLIWGGNALSARLDVLDALLVPGTVVFLAGVAANTMLQAQGHPVGRSAVEESYLAGARTLADQLGDRLILPSDLAVGKSPRATTRTERDVRSIQPEDMALDLGQRSIAQLKRLISQAKTIVWCGSVGFFKSSSYSAGTTAVCEGMAQSDAFTMVIAEDSVSAAHSVGRASLAQMDCVSLGGAATLSLLKNNKLPGLAALVGSNHE
ncbi:MAG TPA: phosphoglycerate kinase [Polyangiaceae bacterium]|nr:phosphoglycerate kinase [Polyangiaceae bacterium]